MERQLISSGSPWEPKVGYSRAVRVGNMVFVAGTIAADEQGLLQGPGDAYAQTKYAIQKIERALAQAGAGLKDVVRTRLFVRDIDDFEAVARAHGEFFTAIRPASSMIEVGRFTLAGALIEIEMDAVIGG
jgi:enamine deaminase RidA (YjgF/YER057c/UK114 family)